MDAAATFKALSDAETRAQAYHRLLQLLNTDAEALVAPLKDLLSSETPQVAFNGLAAMFELDAVKTLSIVQRQLVQSALIDAASACWPAKRASSLAQTASFAFLLSTAASIPSARPLLQALDAEAWLQAACDQSSNEPLRIIALTALAKLLFGQTSQQPEVYGRLDKLAVALLHHLASADKIHESALEGMAILSLLPSVRSKLFASDAALQRLCCSDLLPPKSATATPEQVQRQFSLACVFSNITSTKPAADPTTKRLQQLASQQSGAQAEWEEDAVVLQRCQKVLQLDTMDCFESLVRCTSLAARRKTGQALANLTAVQTPPTHRGKMVQQGAAAMFLNLARQDPTLKDSSQPAAEILQAVQGLARLLITANPALVLTAPLQVEALKLVARLFTSADSTLLQIFESAMALTNLTSQSEQAREQFISDRPETMLQVDQVLLYDAESSTGHALCRRAATQLACNLTMCAHGFAHFAGDSELSTTQATMPPLPCQTRLHLLLALSDVQDVATRMAASAAIAVLTVSPDVCLYLLTNGKIKQRTLDIFQALVQDSDVGLRQRGLACIGNLLQRLSLLPTESRTFVAQSEWINAVEQLPAQEKSDAEPLLAQLQSLT